MRIEIEPTKTALREQPNERLQTVQLRREYIDQDNNGLERENAELLAALKRHIVDALETLSRNTQRPE